MKIQDIDKVNHLIGELNGMKELIAHAERADPADCELFIKLPGDSSIRLSSEGAASTHYQGFSASASPGSPTSPRTRPAPIPRT